MWRISDMWRILDFLLYISAIFPTTKVQSEYTKIVHSSTHGPFTGKRKTWAEALIQAWAYS